MVSHTSPVLVFGTFQFEPAARRLLRDGVEIPLQPRVLGVLECLLAQPGVVVSKGAILDTVWKDACVTDASLAEAVSALRSVLGDDPQKPLFIQTVHRRGYRFVALIDRPPPSRDEPVFASAGPPKLGEGWASEGGSQTTSTHTLTPASLRPARVWDPVRWLPWGITACAVCVAIASAWQAARPATPPRRPPARLALPLPSTDRVAAGAVVATSPDGQWVVWVAARDHRSVLMLRAIDRAEAIVVDATDRASAPFFSPDGGWIGFFADGKLKKTAVHGGQPHVVADARDPAGASWTTDGTIVFAQQGRVVRVSENGGDVEVIAAPRPGSSDLAYAWPSVLPNGEAALVTVLSTAAPRVAALTLRTGHLQEIVAGSSYARFTSTGHLVFARGRDLFAATFDLTRLELSGPAIPIVTGVATDGYDASAAVTFSSTGTLIYLPDVAGHGASTMRWIDGQGREYDLPVPARSYRGVSLAPDGRRAAVTIGDQRTGDTWIGDLDRGTLRRLTFDGQTLDPVWTPDGHRVVFAAGRGGPFNLFWQPVDRDGDAEPLAPSTHHQFPDSWSPDGRTLAYTDIDPQTRADLWLLSLDEDAARSTTAPFVRTKWDETAAAFSPDGRWVAYQSNESGRWEVYLSARADPAERHPISADGGASAAWSPDGRTIFYRGDHAIMGVGVATDRSVELSRPRAVVAPHDGGPFVIGSDGRFLSLKAAAAPPPSHFNVVLNWFAELERVMPAPLPRTIR